MHAEVFGGKILSNGLVKSKINIGIYIHIHIHMIRPHI